MTEMVTMHRGFQTNLQLLKASRAQQRPGDVFMLRIADDKHLFGRVIRGDALWTLRDPEHRDDDSRANLVYIYDHVSRYSAVPEMSVLSRNKLLIPPLFVDRLWWARGYFQTLTNISLAAGDTLQQHCFRKPSSGRYYDEYNNELPGPHEPIGRLALPNISLIDTKISRALDIPEVNESEDG